jgi:signal transduction histidine kinase
VSVKLRVYVAAVLVAAAILIATNLPPDLARHGVDYLLWVGICVASESLWLPTLSGTGTVTMASSAGLATIVLWGRSAALGIGALSTLGAELLVLRKPLVRASFNAGQITLTTWLAGTAFALAGGPLGGLEHLTAAPAGAIPALRLAPAILALFVVYLVVNRALVAVAVSWAAERPYLRVLREDWFYAERLVEDAAAFLLSPLMVVSFEAIGYVGAALFYAPLRMFNESHRRYLELQRTQRMLIHTERMAAKGEMAAEIGHELRNILTAISARAQMISRDHDKNVYANVARNTQIILEQSKRMETMSRGLMDFSRAELSVEKIELNALIERTVELMRMQNRFDGVSWDMDLASPEPELRADPGQLTQVLTNLFLNAADAMREHGTVTKSIRVATAVDERTRQATIVVSDSGPGIPGSNLAKVFEPHFTTKKEGHGFGLSTSFRIIETHKGKIVAESPPGSGAVFTITLPMQGPGAWS